MAAKPEIVTPQPRFITINPDKSRSLVIKGVTYTVPEEPTIQLLIDTEELMNAAGLAVGQSDIKTTIYLFSVATGCDIADALKFPLTAMEGITEALAGFPQSW
jgi:hypothetical protein